jgi:hypothetical protein
MNQNDFVTVNRILANVTVQTNDRDFRSGMSKGWYISRIHEALQELSFDTFFEEITLDFPFPSEKLALMMPKNVFNVRDIYLWNGDCCSPDTSVIVHWKKGYNNRGKGEGYTAKVRENGSGNSSDPYFPQGGDRYWDNGIGFNSRNLYYANIQNGMIMFSSACKSYENVRITFNGMGGEIGDLPIVPRFFERAVGDYVSERFFNSKKAEDQRKYRTLWGDAEASLNDPRKGSWKKARMRVSSMNTFERKSMNEYISAIYHK